VSAQGPAPAVTVLMSVHDGAAYLKEAVDSVLGQTFRDFELVVVDDGSTDATPGLLAAYADPRLRVVRQENRGLAAALNRGLDLARGRYVARMDADDVCLPGRLARQVAFLDSHPEVDVLGAWVETFGERAGDVWRYPPDAASIRCRLLFENVLAHPSVVMRRAALEREGLRYDPDFRYGQDYELWQRAGGRLTFANLQEVLVRLRIREGAPERAARRRERARLLGAVYARALGELGLRPTAAELALHMDLGAYRYGKDALFLAWTEAWLTRLLAANGRARVYPERELGAVIGRVWLAAFRHGGRGDWGKVGRFARSPLTRLVALRPRLRALVHAARVAATAAGPREAAG
jgi:glycosyltransferase involved in cell wall biosynthesis